MKHESDGDIYNWCARNGLQKFGQRSGTAGNRRRSREHPNYIIVKIGQNNEKSRGDLRRLVVTQTSVKDLQKVIIIRN